MLTHPTLDQLRALKLDGMADAFVELQAKGQAEDLAHAEWLALLLDREGAVRSTKRFQTRLRAARLRHGQATVERGPLKRNVRRALRRQQGKQGIRQQNEQAEGDHGSGGTDFGAYQCFGF